MTDGNLDSNAEAMAIVEGSRSHFSIRDHNRGDEVRRFLHDVVFFLVKTLMCSVLTNGIHKDHFRLTHKYFLNNIFGCSKNLNQF